MHHYGEVRERASDKEWGDSGEKDLKSFLSLKDSSFSSNLTCQHQTAQWLLSVCQNCSSSTDCCLKGPYPTFLRIFSPFFFFCFYLFIFVYIYKCCLEPHWLSLYEQFELKHSSEYFAEERKASDQNDISPNNMFTYTLTAWSMVYRIAFIYTWIWVIRADGPEQVFLPLIVALAEQLSVFQYKLIPFP